tara:strand:- start:4 stop:648 length:645 start_codon:yes stop_codon:yes gene_type:complete
MRPHLKSSLSPYIRFCQRGISVIFLALVLQNCSNTILSKSDLGWLEQRELIEQSSNWQLRGRVNVRYHDESHTPRIQWQQQDDKYRIRLWGTFNAGNTIITGEPNSVTMEHDGKIVTAKSPEDLILENLGYELPVSYLEFWIRSLPSPKSDSELEFNDLENLSMIKQDGWEVSYPEVRQFDGVTLPRRVEITKTTDDIRLRFVGLSWVVNSGAD